LGCGGVDGFRPNPAVITIAHHDQLSVIAAFSFHSVPDMYLLIFVVSSYTVATSGDPAQATQTLASLVVLKLLPAPSTAQGCLNSNCLS
jgi:hypothetical protein